MFEKHRPNAYVSMTLKVAINPPPLLCSPKGLWLRELWTVEADRLLAHATQSLHCRHGCSWNWQCQTYDFQILCNCFQTQKMLWASLNPPKSVALPHPIWIKLADPRFQFRRAAINITSPGQKKSSLRAPRQLPNASSSIPRGATFRSPCNEGLGTGN